MKKPPIAWILCCVLSSSALAAITGVQTDKIYVAEAKKSKTYIGNGVVVGGDWGIDDVVIKGIRRAPNIGFERIVVDMEGTRNGEPAALDRPPYYHVAVHPQSQKLIITVLGKPKLKFSPEKVAALFKNSSVVKKVELLPMVEKDRWAFVLDLKQPSGVEVFELSNPTRIILDVQARAPKSAVKLQETDFTEEN